MAADIASGSPRVIVLAAPAGYGKSAFLEAYAAFAGPLIACDLPSDPAASDLARPIVDALVANDRGRAARSAADRLALWGGLPSGSSRETLRNQWPGAEAAELFALSDRAGALASPAGAELFAELIATLPMMRTLAVSSRIALPPALMQIVGRERAVTLGTEDLAFSRNAVADLAAAAGLDDAIAESAFELADGWPLVTQLLIGLAASDDRLPEVLSSIRALPRDALLPYTAHRTIAALQATVRDALVIAATQRGATHAQLVRILGEECDDLVFAELARLPFVTLAGQRAVVHREICAVLRERFGSLVKTLYERTLSVLTGEGAYVEAAQVALDGGDPMRAAAALDTAPPYTAVPAPLADYERVIDRLDRSLIARFPNLWIATIPYRSFAVDRPTFVREAETVYYCLGPVARSEQRAAAVMLLASAYVNSGRRPEADRLIDEALQGFARELSPARASLLNFAAWLYGMDGRFALARSLAMEAALISRSEFDDNQTLHYIDVHEAAYRGQTERVVVIIDELLRRLETDELPLHRANAATNGAIITWVNGDDQNFRRYVDALEDVMTPGLARGFGPFIDGARGRPLRFTGDFNWPVLGAMAQLFRLGNAETDEEALDAARAAARGADERGDPYTAILSHAALYTLDESARTYEAAVLEALVAPVESPEMHAGVAALLRAEPAGIFQNYLTRRVLRQRIRRTPRFTVALLSRQVQRDGVRVRLSDKEFELLALLGSSHAPISRDRIGEALWDHLDPEEWPNNLKVTLSRLRAKLGMPDAVVAVDGRYRLSPAIEVDLRAAEALVRSCSTGPLDEARRNDLRTLLDAYASAGSEAYERLSWGQPLLARIHELTANAGTLLARDAEGRDAHEALRLADLVSEIDPFSEAACEMAIRVLLERGELDSARRRFRRYASALANELGAAPSPHIAELVRSGGQSTA